MLRRPCRGGQWIRVVEAGAIRDPSGRSGMYHLVEDAGTEPIGVPIVEAPEDEALEGLRPPRIGFVAYVPVGAIKKGEDLVTTGGNGRRSRAARVTVPI